MFFFWRQYCTTTHSAPFDAPILNVSDYLVNLGKFLTAPFKVRKYVGLQENYLGRQENFAKKCPRFNPLHAPHPSSEHLFFSGDRVVEAVDLLSSSISKLDVGLLLRGLGIDPLHVLRLNISGNSSNHKDTKAMSRQCISIFTSETIPQVQLHNIIWFAFQFSMLFHSLFRSQNPYNSVHRVLMDS